MANGQTQQPTQPQSDGLLSDIGSTIGKVLPYALPAALGAAMGGIGGAGAGLAMGASGAQEQEAKQAELSLKWQEFGIEKQKMQLAMRDDAEWQNYTAGLPADERAMARKDPQGYAQNYIQNTQWQHTITTLKGDPQFAASIGIKDPKFVDALAGLDPKHGEQVFTKYLEASQSGKYPGGVHGPYEDGKGGYYMLGLGMNGEQTQIPVGKPVPAMVAGATLGERTTHDISEENKAADTRWSSDYKEAEKAALTRRPLLTKGSELMTGATPSDAVLREELHKRGHTDEEINQRLGAPSGGKTKTADSASRSGAPVPKTPPKGYVISKLHGPKGETLYENPMAPANKRYWSMD